MTQPSAGKKYFCLPIPDIAKARGGKKLPCLCVLSLTGKRECQVIERHLLSYHLDRGIQNPLEQLGVDPAGCCQNGLGKVAFQHECFLILKSKYRSFKVTITQLFLQEKTKRVSSEGLSQSKYTLEFFISITDFAWASQCLFFVHLTVTVLLIEK